MEGIVLLSLFRWLEGARRAFDLWGVAPIRHLSCEIDAAAVRESRPLRSTFTPSINTGAFLFEPFWKTVENLMMYSPAPYSQ